MGIINYIYTIAMHEKNGDENNTRLTPYMNHHHRFINVIRLGFTGMTSTRSHQEKQFHFVSQSKKIYELLST